MRAGWWGGRAPNEDAITGHPKRRRVWEARVHMEDVMQDRVDQLVGYIMKHCLWQFHSRTWDRERQNKEILQMTAQLLCNEEVQHDTLFDRCYWADAVYLADAYRSRYPWLAMMAKAEIKELMRNLHERMDYLTIKGSLNAELTDKNY